jgi:hypothetical protein
MLEGKPLFPGKDREWLYNRNRSKAYFSLLQTSTSSQSSPNCSVHHQTMLFRPSPVKTYVTTDFGQINVTDARTNIQTLRFVQSLPKRERVPFSKKFTNADPLGMSLALTCLGTFLIFCFPLDSPGSARKDARVRSSFTNQRNGRFGPRVPGSIPRPDG